MKILDRIVARKKEEVAALKTDSGSIMAGRDQAIDPPRGFRRALLADPGVSIIAEVKKASPSKGVIREDFDPVAIGRMYEAGGATCISVLTDRDFFQGSLDYLVQVRRAVGLPVLRKDFIIDPIQIDEAYSFGADAILLIAGILSTQQIAEYIEYARTKTIDVLVEVHDEEELAKALRGGAELIGVNNRDLRDFSVDITTTLRLKERIPDHIPVVSESGLNKADDIVVLRDSGVAAALIGESFMRQTDPGALLATLRQAGTFDHANQG
jgi:indole-3-glycerol phosphate synthase